MQMMSSERLSVSLWVRVTEPSVGADYLALASDKAWSDGMIEDYTSHHDFGRSRSTGVLPGWVLALTPEGGWTWNLGDGTARLDYRPTVARQAVVDGGWHMLAFTLDRGAQEAWLYYDGQRVSVYSIAGLGECLGSVDSAGEAGAGWSVEDVRVTPGVVRDPASIREEFQRRTGDVVPADGMSQQRVGEVRVLAWNIWHGGRRDGDEAGLEATISAIRNSGADIVTMQETYGSGVHIADALGFHFYLRSSNLSIMSRFPICATYDLFQPFNFGGVCLQLSPSQYLRVFTTWLHYLPDYGGNMKADGEVTVERLLQEEAETRAAEATRILAELVPLLEESEQIPVVMAGDFNSPSHLDWRQNTAPRHRDLVVDWPVSLAMLNAGFQDAYRTAVPDPVVSPGYTWSPRFSEAWKDRIDFVYCHGAVTTRSAYVLDEQAPAWPSDHGAALVSLELS